MKFSGCVDRPRRTLRLDSTIGASQIVLEQLTRFTFLWNYLLESRVQLQAQCIYLDVGNH